MKKLNDAFEDLSLAVKAKRGIREIKELAYKAFSIDAEKVIEMAITTDKVMAIVMTVHLMIIGKLFAKDPGLLLSMSRETLAEIFALGCNALSKEQIQDFSKLEMPPQDISIMLRMNSDLFPELDEVVEEIIMQARLQLSKN